MAFEGVLVYEDDYTSYIRSYKNTWSKHVKHVIYQLNEKTLCVKVDVL